MTYYKVVRVYEAGLKRTSVIRHGKMKMYYSPDSWTHVPERLAELGCGLFVYSDEVKMIEDILNYGWAVDGFIEIWEVIPEKDTEMFYHPKFTSIMEAEGGFFEFKDREILPEGVHMFGGLKLTRLRASMNRHYWKEFYDRERRHVNKFKFGKGIADLLERSKEMRGSIRYEHYRPRLGTLPKDKGATPNEVLFRYSRGYRTFEPDPKGGKTICYITLPSGAQYMGETYCSMSDSFCFSEGRAWALKYALENMLENDFEPEVVEGMLQWHMPLEDGQTIAKYIKTFLNNSRMFSDVARNELYKALNNVKVFGIPSKD